MQKIKPFRSKKYLAWVRQQRCCHCHIAGPCDPHHLIGFGHGSTGATVGDNFAVPLHRACHNEFHDGLTGDARIEWIIAQIYWLQTTQTKAFNDGIVEVKG